MPLGNNGGGGGMQAWEPSVVYLLALVLAEIIIMGIIRSLTKHGG
jgi:hypothetical protein